MGWTLDVWMTPGSFPKSENRRNKKMERHAEVLLETWKCGQVLGRQRQESQEVERQIPLRRTLTSTKLTHLLHELEHRCVSLLMLLALNERKYPRFSENRTRT